MHTCILLSFVFFLILFLETKKHYLDDFLIRTAKIPEHALTESKGPVNNLKNKIVGNICPAD